MASLLRKAKHLGKSKVKFQFDVEVTSLSNAPAKINGPVSIVWTRGPRVATTTLAAVDTTTRTVTWNERISLVVTLYRKNASQFQEKSAKFSLKEETQRKAQKTHGQVTVNLAEFASADGAPITRNLKLSPGSKSGAAPTLKVTIVSNWLKDYTGDDDDTASQMTDISRFSIGGDYSEALSTNASDDIGELDIDDDLGVGRRSSGAHGPPPSFPAGSSEGDITGPSRPASRPPQAPTHNYGPTLTASNISNIRPVHTSAPLGRSPLSKQSDGDSVARYQHEIADLRQQLTEVTAAKEEAAIRTRHEQEQLTTRLRGLEQMKQILEDEVTSLKKRNHAMVEDLQADLEQEIVKAKEAAAERDYLKTRIMHEEEETLRLQTELNATRPGGAAASAGGDLSSENASLRARNRELSDEVASLQSRLASAREEAKQARHARRHAGGDGTLSASPSKSDVDSGDRDLAHELQASEKARIAAEEDLKDFTQQLISAKLQLAESAGEVFGLHQQIKSLKKELAFVARGNRALGKRFAKLEVRYEAAKQDK